MENVSLFPPIEAYNEFYLEVSSTHQVFVMESGNPNGKPVIIVHGGPGGGSSPVTRQLFNPDVYRMIQFDQRGCGKSLPFLSLEENTTQHLVSDMEKIREKLGIDQWLVFGGSWGTTLSLHYAIQYPERVKGLILRGIFLGRQEDTDWLYQKGASDFFPDQFEPYLNHIPVEEQDDLVTAYYKRLTSEDASIRLEAARQWARWEGGIVTLLPRETIREESDEHMLAIAIMECHYFYHHCFVEDDNYILNHVDTLKEIPIKIVHGRYDVDCRPSGAYDLKQKLPHAELVFSTAAGHAQMEPSTVKELLRFAREFE